MHNTTIVRIVRRGETRDLPEVLAIQQASPEAAQWDVTDYPQYDFRVVCEDGRICGFVVARALAPGERELLNLAVAPERRGQGVGKTLLGALLADRVSTLYLEVRESNAVARKFYEMLGFQEVSVRHEYYNSPPEAAIVMKFHSC